MHRNAVWLAACMLLAAQIAVRPDHAFAGESDDVEVRIAKLRSELAAGVVSEFTVRDLVGSTDARKVAVLGELLARSESLRSRLRGSAAIEFAAWGLGYSRDKGAIPILMEFLAKQMSAKMLDPDTVVCQRPLLSGATVNLRRVTEAMYAALSLYRLGDWRTALPALDTLVQQPHEDAPHVRFFLWRAVEDLSTVTYEDDSAATNATAAYFRRACRSPFLDVRAGAALSLAPLDPLVAYETARELISCGPDHNPSSPACLAHHKRVALMALAAVGDARSVEFLKALAANGAKLVREEARNQMRVLKKERP